MLPFPIISTQKRLLIIFQINGLWKPPHKLQYQTIEMKKKYCTCQHKRVKFHVYGYTIALIDIRKRRFFLNLNHNLHRWSIQIDIVTNVFSAHSNTLKLRAFPKVVKNKSTAANLNILTTATNDFSNWLLNYFLWLASPQNNTCV